MKYDTQAHAEIAPKPYPCSACGKAAAVYNAEDACAPCQRDGYWKHKKLGKRLSPRVNGDGYASGERLEYIDVVPADIHVKRRGA